jgi:hypothetical protein
MIDVAAKARAHRPAMTLSAMTNRAAMANLEGQLEY